MKKPLKYYVDIIRVYPKFGEVRTKGIYPCDNKKNAKYFIWRLQCMADDHLRRGPQKIAKPYEIRENEIVEKRSYRIMRRIERPNK